MPDLRAYLQRTRTCEAAAVSPGSSEAAAPLIRLFSRRRAGPASSGVAEEETMGETWWAGGRYRGGIQYALGFNDGGEGNERPHLTCRPHPSRTSLAGPSLALCGQRRPTGGKGPT